MSLEIQLKILQLTRNVESEIYYDHNKVNINQAFKTYSITTVWIIHVEYNKQIISHYSGFETISSKGPQMARSQIWSIYILHSKQNETWH